MNAEKIPDWAWIEVYRPFDDRIRPQCSDVVGDRATARALLQRHLDGIPEFAAAAMELRTAIDGPGGLLLYYDAGWPYTWTYFPIPARADVMAVGIALIAAWRSRSDRYALVQSARRRPHHVLTVPLP